MVTWIFISEIVMFIIMYYFKSKKEKSYIHLELIFLLAYILVTSAYYFQKILTNNQNGVFIVREYIDKTVLITFGGFISFIIIFAIQEHCIKRKKGFYELSSNSKFIKRYYIISLIVCFAMTFISIAVHIQNGSFIKQRGIDQFNVSKIEMIVSQFSLFQLVSLFVLIQLSLTLYKKISKAVVFLMAIILISSFILGGRLIIFSGILGLLIIINSFKKVKKKTIGIVLAAGLVINYIITMIRIMRRSNGILSNILSLKYGVLDVIKRVCETLACSDIDTLITSLYVNSDKLLYGKSYLGSFINMLFPKSIFGFYFFEPINVSFKKAFYSNITSVGYDFTMVSESIMNFGILGPIIIMGVMAVIMWRLSRNIDKNDIFMPLKVFILMRLMFALRTDSNATIKSIVYTSIFYFILLFISGKSKLVKIKPKENKV